MSEKKRENTDTVTVQIEQKVWETAQPLKCLAHIHGDLSLNLRHPHKIQVPQCRSVTTAGGVVVVVVGNRMNLGAH